MSDNKSEMPVGAPNNVHVSGAWLDVDAADRSKSKAPEAGGEVVRPRSEEMEIKDKDGY